MWDTMDGSWETAVEDLTRFNAAYALLERKPNDQAACKKCLNAADKLLSFWIWGKKALTEDQQAKVLSATRGVHTLVKVKDYSDSGVATLQHLKNVLQEALDTTAPAEFTYQGFKVSNPEHFADELCRKTLEGIDF